MNEPNGTNKYRPNEPDPRQINMCGGRRRGGGCVSGRDPRDPRDPLPVADVTAADADGTSWPNSPYAASAASQGRTFLLATPGAALFYAAVFFNSSRLFSKGGPLDTIASRVDHNRCAPSVDNS